MQIHVIKAEPGTQLYTQLIAFVRQSSWDDVREHTAQMLEERCFTDWEAMFAAVADGAIIGHAALLKTDYYPLPELCPWINTVFVTEQFRGKGVCGALLDAAEQYAKAIGFSRIYLASEHAGIYEKYGYVYEKDIVNYGGETDRLYTKDLEEASE